MEERKTIESKHYNAAIIGLIIFLIGLLPALVMIISGLYHSATEYEDQYSYYYGMYSSYGKEFAKELASGYVGIKPVFIIKHLFERCRYHINGWICLYIIFQHFVIGAVAYFGLRSYSLTITDKCIYGKTMFGNRVELPIDSISMITTISLLKGIVVTTSIKKKKVFLLIKNLDDVYRELNDLVIEKRHNAKVTNGDKENRPIINAEELKKMKELLDMGIITQEEFDAKKKQLLGL